MKISWRWLSEYVDLDGIDPVATAEQFTLSVAELEGVEQIGRGLDDVVAARIVSVEDHPNADRLKVVKVDTGKGQTQCVSGAPNLNVGDVGLFAPAGVTLPNGMKLKSAKMRGVVSEGMLVAEDELGLPAELTSGARGLSLDRGMIITGLSTPKIEPIFIPSPSTRIPYFGKV
jgi:phenylalanyl-tRNA synthetase beta chain